MNGLLKVELCQHEEWEGSCLMAQQGKNSPAMQETSEAQVPSLGWEDPLEEEMSTHSSILIHREILWTEELGGLQSLGSQTQTQWAAMPSRAKGERCCVNSPMPAGAKKTSNRRNRTWVTTILGFYLRLVKAMGCRSSLTWVWTLA